MRKFPGRLFVALALAASLCASPAGAANALYGKYRQALISWSDAGLSAAIDLKTDTIKVACVSSSYTPNTATHQFWSSASANVIGTPQAITWTSGTAGKYIGGNVSFSIPGSTTVTYLVIYKDTGTTTTSPLLCILDTGTGLPFTSGSSTTTLNVTWDGTNGIYTP